jgi:hypothetical protein
MKSIRFLLAVAASALVAGFLMILAAGAADEITLSYQLTVEKGNLSFSRNVQAQTVTMTGDSVSYQVQSVGTNVSTLLTFGADVSTCGVFFVRNQSTNLYVRIGPATNTWLFNLPPGKCAMGHLGTNQLYALAQTNSGYAAGSSAMVEHTVVEE